MLALLARRRALLQIPSCKSIRTSVPVSRSSPNIHSKTVSHITKHPFQFGARPISTLRPRYTRYKRFGGDPVFQKNGDGPEESRKYFGYRLRTFRDAGVTVFIVSLGVYYLAQYVLDSSWRGLRLIALTAWSVYRKQGGGVT